MVAATAQPIAAMSQVSKMNPTSTEHDFRFPRRPTGRDNLQTMRAPDNGEHGARLSLLELTTGLNGAYASAGNALLGPAQFPVYSHGDDGSDGPSSRSQQQDESIATQLFKILAQYKQQTPNQRRMENMTWRLMSLQMRQQSLEAKRQKYDSLAIFLSFLPFLPILLPAASSITLLLVPGSTVPPPSASCYT